MTFPGTANASAPRAIVFLAAVICAVLVSPARALDHTQLAVVINTEDPLSVEIGEYYAGQRQILFQNIIKVAFAPGKQTLTAAEFAAIKKSVDQQTLPGVQAYALTWAEPYRVECMSITAAFAFGFDTAYCAGGCKLTKQSAYFNSPARLPFTQLRMRPAMSIAATSFERAKELIDRGVASDGTFPGGTAYLLSTSDKNRNVRALTYAAAEKLLGRRLRVSVLQRDALKYEHDVLFYFTGRANVEGLDTLRFMPGAMADHLTSSGGDLTGQSGQMSALRWLEAGATGSYGTVVEPCAFPQKFPQPVIAIAYYLAGDTLIEAYWKSVAMPGQGIFIGEPLAAPFRQVNLTR